MRAIICFLFGLVLIPSALAQVLADPTSVIAEDSFAVGGGYYLSEVDYDADINVESERKIIGADLSYGGTKNLTFFGYLGIINDTDANADSRYNDDIALRNGDGMVYGAGARFRYHQTEKLKFNGYGALTVISEEFQRQGVDVENAEFDVEANLDITEIYFGAIMSYTATPTIRPYGGLELILSSDGEVESKHQQTRNNAGAELLNQPNRSSNDDIERDGVLNLKLGAVIALRQAYLRPEVTLAGERTMAFAAAYLF